MSEKECDFCNNKAIKYQDGYWYCRKCFEEEIKFMLMTDEQREHLLKLYEKQLEKMEELIELEKRSLGLIK